MRQCLHLALTRLAYDSIDVWGAVVDLVSHVLVLIERRGGDWNVFLGGGSRCNDAMTMTCDEVALRLLPILRERMKYPNDHKFDHEECRWMPRGGVPHKPLQGLPARHESPPGNRPVVCGRVLWRSPCIIVVIVALAHVISHAGRQGSTVPCVSLPQGKMARTRGKDGVGGRPVLRHRDSPASQQCCLSSPLGGAAFVL